MMNPHDITVLLNRVTEGDPAAKEELYRRLYEDLMRLARTHRYRAGHITLDAPAILNESFLRFRSGVFPNRSAFLGYASTVMHTVIVDYVRERKAQKRGGELRNELTLNTGIEQSAIAEDKVEDLHDALLALEQIDQRAYRVVEMRYFAGLSEEEVAEVLGVSAQTVTRDWRRAKAFLLESMRDSRGGA
jgi:RNA polymerase sigma factor (TIGR02999 family)